MNTKTREGVSVGRNLRCLEMFLAISKGKENFVKSKEGIQSSMWWWTRERLSLAFEVKLLCYFRNWMMITLWLKILAQRAPGNPPKIRSGHSPNNQKKIMVEGQLPTIPSLSFDFWGLWSSVLTITSRHKQARRKKISVIHCVQSYQT